MTAIFHDSTPAPNIDGSIPRPWRVASADALADLLAELTDLDCWVEHALDWRGCASLYVGLRSKVTPAERNATLTDVAERIRATGAARVHVEWYLGHVRELRVYDVQKKRTARAS